MGQEGEKFIKNLPLPFKSVNPDNISINVKGQIVTVEVKTEQRADDGSYSSEGFRSQFSVSPQVDITKMTSTWTPDGQLKIEAPYVDLKQQQPQQICDLSSVSSSSGLLGSQMSTLKNRDKWTLDVPIVEGIDPMKLQVYVKDNLMTIEAKIVSESGENENSCTKVLQEFTSKVTLPPNINISQLTSTWTKEGSLKFEAPYLK